MAQRDCMNAGIIQRSPMINKAWDLPSISQLDFSVHKLISGETAWINPDAAYQAGANDKAAFFSRFAYAIADTRWIEALRFDRHERRMFRAERYGGAGIGDNGGGVRVGNDGQFQVKGIGRNELCGSGADTFHSYGALNAPEAIYEAIYSAILNKLMPVGAIGVHGVMATGVQAAYYRFNDWAAGDYQQGWGALLVRERCQRPSHYIRAGLFKPAESGSGVMASDVARTRATNRQLFRQCGDANQAIRYFGKFLQNCANQFAFARVARIVHGTLSPSNIAVDGRWVDLACTSFVQGGENSGYLVPFYREPEAVVHVFKEWFEGFAKYNRAT